MREYDVFIPSRLTEVDVWVSNLLRQMSLKFNTDMIIKFENTADIASGMYISGNEKTVIKTSGIKTRKDIFEKAENKLLLDFTCHTSGDLDVGGSINLIIKTEPILLYNGELISLNENILYIETSPLALSDGKTISGESKIIIKTNSISDISSIKYLNITDITSLDASTTIQSTKAVALNEIGMIIETNIAETIRRLRLLGDIQTTDTLNTYGSMSLSDFYYITE